MKKVKLVIITISNIFLFGCVNANVSLEQSQKNFTLYEESIKIVSAKYGYEVVELFDVNIENQLTYKDLQITLSKNAEIYIRMGNNAYYTEYGLQGFLVSYTITEASVNNENFNIDLFTDLINTMSGKSISRDFCLKFLNAPEGDYPASRYGFEKLNGEIIAKQKNFGFFDDWLIMYTFDSYDEEQLKFGGLTK